MPATRPNQPYPSHWAAPNKNGDQINFYGGRKERPEVLFRRLMNKEEK